MIYFGAVPYSRLMHPTLKICLLTSCSTTRNRGQVRISKAETLNFSLIYPVSLTLLISDRTLLAKIAITGIYDYTQICKTSICVHLRLKI